MTKLRILDPCAPRPYDLPSSLKGLGGTEATVLKVARAVSQNHPVSIEQAGRQEHVVCGNLRFAPLSLSAEGGDVIVVINSWKAALKVRRANPEARILLWLHIYPGKHNRKMGARLAAAGVDVLCVSRTHAEKLRQFLPVQPRVGFIYNPICDALAADNTPRDPNLLIFASSPHKGLVQVLEHFRTVRRAIPDLRLQLADPGYIRWPIPDLPEGIELCGALDQPQLIAKFRRALCLFYPQTHFAETFGLVIAEANAVGCPALLHAGTGANKEIASSTEQCLEELTPQALVERITRWREVPPRVGPRPQFRLTEVVQQWEGLLRGSASHLPGWQNLPPTPRSPR